MKVSIALAVIFVVAACLATQASAVGAPGAPGVAAPEAHLRSKRATCDLLSGTGVNHSACAAHCVLRGNKGGYCSPKAVCICRN